MRIENVSFRRLRYFLAVAEELHFGRAASRIGVAQPALSRQIAALEDAIGTRLFDRIRSKVHLTEAGAVLVPQAREILLRVTEAARGAKAAGDGVVGTLSVGFVGSATYSTLPAAFQRFRESHPHVDLLLYAMNNAQLREGLINRTIDIAFARSKLADDEFLSKGVLEEPLVAVIPEAHRFARETKVSLRKLEADRFILYPRHPRPSFADQVISLCREAGFEPPIADEVMDLQTALALVSVGAGLSIVPASVENSHRHGVRYVGLSEQEASTTLFMVWRRDNRSSVLANFQQQLG